MKNIYSVIKMNEDHLEEICQDVKQQYEQGIANCVLFVFQLVPEGIPYIDKAMLQGEKYKRFSSRLREMGIECGVLVQCTIGHGWLLNSHAKFQRYVNLIDGEIPDVYCPYDEELRNYFREQFAIIASLSPQLIMVDDDFRLMYRGGMGCACKIHMEEFSRLVGADVKREELLQILQGGHEKTKEYTELYVETQRQALLGCAIAMREGIDRVNPALPGAFCSVGSTTEFAGEIAQILAGKNNPVMVRINNANYTALGARNISESAFRMAQQSEMLKNVEVILAETDTCPQNRYSTSAQLLHAHYTVSILEGARGAKHWITRTAAHEPNSGKAYRKILERNKGFYEKLMEVVPELEWQGCRIPLPTVPDYGFTHGAWYSVKAPWASCVLERFGLPVYFSSENTGATFLDGGMVSCLTDDEIRQMFTKTLFLSSDAVAMLNERGFSQYTGVEVKEWNLPIASFERLMVNQKQCSRQWGIRELIPNRPQVLSDSTVYHLENDTDEIPLCPGSTIYDNPVGGRTIVFCGTPDAPYHISSAFSFLNESRKAQITRLLFDSGNLPIYYSEDAEVYLKAAYMPDGAIFCAIFNIGFDVLEDIPLVTERHISKVSRLDETGKFVPCDFSVIDGVIRVGVSACTLEPVILKLYERRGEKNDSSNS